ncbi:ThuA domain-containing protein [bacterium]|nr:ThuA domain-containing protein [bacterium]MDC0322305.1 ThuA domain-containing protein [Verrucomicrobiales bacterium]
MKKLLTLFTLLACSIASADHHAGKVLKLAGKEGPGKGKKIVLVAGDEEYRSEESMPMLGKILSQKHGFDCVVVFSWDKSGKYIDPNNQEGLIGLSELDDADLMVIGTRFRKPSEKEAAHLTAFMNAGKPVIGIRTATHAFNGGQKFGDSETAIGFGQWGRKVLGEQWVSHHGRHKVQGARSVVEADNTTNNILRGVGEIFAPSDVYGVKHLTEEDTILLRATVTETLEPDSADIEGEKNNPAQAFAWLHEYTAPNGTAKGMSFCTTGGASVDLIDPDLRRLLVNAAYSLTGLEVQEEADVDYVDPFYPSFYGFIKDAAWWKDLDLQTEEFGLGQSTNLPDPKGSPEWNHEDNP